MLEALSKHKLSAVLRSTSADEALRVATALYNGGLRLIQVTYSVPDTCEAIKSIKKACPDAIVGCGSVTRVEQLYESRMAGAEFAVSPHLDAELLQEATRSGIFYLPGCMTPTEISRAKDLGAQMIKIFPAELIGPKGLRAMLTPFNDLPPVVVTGGVDASNIRDWLAAGATAVCAGSRLIIPEAVEDGDFGKLTTRVQSWLASF